MRVAAFAAARPHPAARRSLQNWFLGESTLSMKRNSRQTRRVERPSSPEHPPEGASSAGCPKNEASNLLPMANKGQSDDLQSRSTHPDPKGKFSCFPNLFVTKLIGWLTHSPSDNAARSESAALERNQHVSPCDVSPESVSGCAAPRIVVPKPFNRPYPGSDDDVIAVTSIGPHCRCPVIVVADGAGGELGGRAAAEIACNTSLKFLTETLKEKTGVLQVMDALKQAFVLSGNEIGLATEKRSRPVEGDEPARGSGAVDKSSQIPGTTTLLILLLCEVLSHNESTAWCWFFAYEGDGHIVLSNPKRAMDGHLLWTHLLPRPGQKILHTATISLHGPKVPPIVGCLAFEPGDRVYVASDGFDVVDKTLWTKRSIYFPHLLAEHLKSFSVPPSRFESLSLEEILAPFEYSDDVSCGLIITLA